MNAVTKMSVKGQVVIPKDVRDKLAWDAGTELQVTPTAGGVLIQPLYRKKQTLTMAQFKKIVKPHEGPYIPESEWPALMEEDLRKRWEERGC
jgi:AbrB family looped-hinge helix DNA binding protein